MSDVKVSVCMITYNQEQYIGQAIESVLAQQTNFPFEIVIGEDCSTDNTRAIVSNLAAGHPDKIRLRLAEQNQGGKRNFVGAFNACRGQYVTILEGDDYFTYSYKLQRQVDALEGRPEWSMCFHPAWCIFEDGEQAPFLLPENWERPEATLLDLFAQNFMATGAVMFRHRLFPALPDWFMDIAVGDWALHILNAAHGNIGFIPEVMSVYRLHSASGYSSQDIGAKLAAAFKMLTAVDHHFGGKYSQAIDQNRLTTLHWLIGQINDAQRIPAETLTLQENCRSLAADNRKLKAFYDEWSGSIAYRVAREAVRPWKQLLAQSRRLRNIAKAPQTADGSITKAA
jgi:glycosyltransferase involved in cell wall biosynthesis